MVTSRPSREHRILLIAYQCAPEGGSVAMIGWRWVVYLSRRCRVFLVTHVRHRAELEGRLPAGVEALFIDTERFAAPLYRFSQRFFSRSQHVLFMIANLDFLLFSALAKKRCRKLGGAAAFDICHVVTPVSPAAPHRLGRIGPPTILGPLNGGMQMPSGFPEIGAAEKAWLFRLRAVGQLLRRLWGTFGCAQLIFSATEVADRAIGRGGQDKLQRLCENGVEEVAETVPDFPASERLELLFVGRLIAVKGVKMLLQALARIERSRFFLQIVGSGPEESHLRSAVKSLGLEPYVRFHGFMAQEKLGDFYRGCHLNVLPSVRESGGATILEAMAWGRPSLALDHGGPRDYISPECGFLLPCRNHEQVVTDMAALLTELADEPARLEAMGAPCLERVRRHFTWQAKIDTAVAAYDRLKGPSS